jgi:predicted lipid-binding transport protein (Tim44 family)
MGAGGVVMTGVGTSEVRRAGGVVTTGMLGSTIGGGGGGGATLGGGDGALIAGAVSVTSVGVIETSFWLSHTSVSASTAMSAATNIDAGSNEPRPRSPREGAPIDFEADVS